MSASSRYEGEKRFGTVLTASSKVDRVSFDSSEFSGVLSSVKRNRYVSCRDVNYLNSLTCTYQSIGSMIALVVLHVTKI